MYMKKADKIPTEIRQTILETETKDDVIDITLAITIIILLILPCTAANYVSSVHIG